MDRLQRVGRLGRNDLKLIGRDHFLVFMVVFAFGIAAMLRVGLPWMNGYLAEQGVLPGDEIPLTLADVYPMFVAYMAIYSGAMIVGTLFGFMLLDEKDNSTLRAMMVTPVPLHDYVLYRVGGPAALAFVIILCMVFIIDQALLPLWQLILLAAGGALTAPIVALFFAGFSENKVQGFAYSKFGGVFGWTILGGWFLAEPWQWLLGIFPPFWVSKAYWMALDGQSGWGLALAAGVLLQIGLIMLLVRRFTRIAYR